MEQPAPAQLHSLQTAPDALFNAPVHLARGRQARDPNAKTVTYTVASLEAFETSLRQFLSNPPANRDHTDCHLSFWIGTSFLVAAPQAQHQQQQQQQQQQQYQQQQHQQHQQHAVSSASASSGPQPHFAAHPHPDASQSYHHTQQQQYGASHYQSVAEPAIALALDLQQPQPSAEPVSANGNANGNGNATASTTGTTKKDEPKVAMSILEALQTTADPKEKMRKQRAIAKACVESIQKCDGYRYSFHNCWNSREDDAFRFSYYCNDSLLNKDRAANGKGAKLGKRATKPVYDCKGVLSIKFSATKQTLDVFYKHIPLHRTYEERAPPPRKDSRRRKFLEENDPEALARIKSRPKSSTHDSSVTDAQGSKKKKKLEDPKSSTTSLESDLRAQSLHSLLELIRPYPAPEPSPPEPPPPPPPPVAQHQQPPPPHQPPRQQPQVQPQLQSQPATRKRSRNSCDVCKAKKTKCDGTRPVCQTCINKKRQCFYSADQLPDDRRPPTVSDLAETAQQAQAFTSELTELERMKRELDEAKARIQELEEEKRRSSTTPLQPPQTAPVPKATRPPQSPPKRQRSRTLSHPVPLPQTPHTVPSPQQAMQQLQTAAQHLQAPQTYTYAQNPYALPPQQSIPRNAAHASQSQTLPLAAGMPPQADNSYAREFGSWPNAYYGYQNTQQQPQTQTQTQSQESPWTTTRNPGVFR